LTNLENKITGSMIDQSDGLFHRTSNTSPIHHPHLSNYIERRYQLATTNVHLKERNFDPWL